MLKVNLDPFYDELEIQIKSTMPLLPEGGSVLDIGCGKGWLTRLLYNNLGGNVIGIDMNRDNIVDCKINADNLPIEYKVLNMINLTPEIFLNFYSFISCHNVLGYIPNPVEQLYKIYSWLQTDGLLSLVVRTPSGRFAEVYEQSKSISLAHERYKDMRMYGSFKDEFEFYSLADLITMIEVAGLSVLKIQGLYSLEKYLPIGYKKFMNTFSESISEEYFFHWILCKKSK